MLDKPLAYTTKKDALNLLKRFNLIEDISDDYSKFVVYRSITQILNNNDLKALLIDLGEGSEVNETDESDPSNELALY
jgi:hypothetical protein